MDYSKSNFVELCTVFGEPIAQVLKSHLEVEGIPSYLRRESIGMVYGLTLDGLGGVSVMVPEELLEEAKRIIEPQDVEASEEEEE